MKVFPGIVACAAFFTAPVIYGAECSPPPVSSSQQAVCYAVAYAKKHGLSHNRALTRKVSRGQKAWTVRFVNARRGARERGWEVDVNAASGEVLRFLSYKPVSS